MPSEVRRPRMRLYVVTHATCVCRYACRLDLPSQDSYSGPDKQSIPTWYFAAYLCRAYNDTCPV